MVLQVIRGALTGRRRSVCIRALAYSWAVVFLVIAGVSAVEGQTRTITAMWDANTDAYTAGYRLYVSVQSGNYPESNSVDVGNATSRQLALPVGATYYFVVRAYNAAGQLGPASNEASIALSAPPPNLPTAQISAAIGPGSTTATVAWQTAQATSAAINGIAVPLAGSAQTTVTVPTTFTLIATGPGGTASASTTAVPPVDCLMSAWSFRSAAAWGACTGGQRARVETWDRRVIRQPADGGSACEALTELRVATESCSSLTTAPPSAPVYPRMAVSGSTATFTWNRATTGGTPTEYFISAGTTQGAADLLDALPVGNTLGVSGQVPPGVYYVRVRAGNSAGVSADSQDVAFRVGARQRPRRPVGFTGSFHGSVVTLSWTTPAGDMEDAPTGYQIEAGLSSGSTELVLPMGNVTRFQTPAPDGVYFVRVRAVNDLGASDPSDEIVLRQGAGPGRPGSLSRSGSGSVATFSWQAPSTGGVPAGYLVEAGTAPGLADLAVMLVGNVTTFSTSLPPGVFYVRVRGVDAQGNAGGASSEVVVQR
jgi:hypothetical protein